MTDGPEERMHPSVQFLLLIVICIGVMIAGALIAGAYISAVFGFRTFMEMGSLGTNSPPYVLASLWILQILSTTIPLFVAPVLFARYVVKQPFEYLKADIAVLNSKAKYPLLFFVIIFLLMFLSAPLMELLININQKMTFPGFLKSVGEWMREKEDEAQKTTQVLLNMKTWEAMVFNVIEIGLLTAIAEEFLFRGCVQTIFLKWTKNPHWAILITAALFSAFHLEFFGFLPRMLLGVFFGYFVYYSGSIWTSVWAHFLNNSTAVVATFLFQHKMIHLNPDDQHVFNFGQYAFSLIITVLLLLVYRNLTLKKAQVPGH